MVLFEKIERWRVDHSGRVVHNPYDSDLRVYDIEPGGTVSFHRKDWPAFGMVVAEEIGVRLFRPDSLDGEKERATDLSPSLRWKGKIQDPDENPIQGVLVKIKDIVGVDITGGKHLQFSSWGPLFSTRATNPSTKLETNRRSFASKAKLSRPGSKLAMTSRWSPSTRMTVPAAVSSTCSLPFESNLTAAGTRKPVASVRISRVSTSKLTTSPRNHLGP